MNISSILYDENINTVDDYLIRREFFGYLNKVSGEGSMSEEDRMMNTNDMGDCIAGTGEGAMFGIGGGGSFTLSPPLYTKEDLEYLFGGVSSFNIYSGKEEREYRKDRTAINKLIKTAVALK